ncbi:hypothetical protein CVT25_006864, partial [Psilocybe cyanescens]
SSAKYSGSRPPGISAYNLQPTTENDASTDSSDEFIEVLDNTNFSEPLVVLFNPVYFYVTPLTPANISRRLTSPAPWSIIAPSIVNASIIVLPVPPHPMPSSSFLLPSSETSLSAFFPHSQPRFRRLCLCLPSYPVHNIFGIRQIKPCTSRSNSY